MGVKFFFFGDLLMLLNVDLIFRNKLRHLNYPFGQTNNSLKLKFRFESRSAGRWANLRFR